MSDQQSGMWWLGDKQSGRDGSHRRRRPSRKQNKTTDIPDSSPEQPFNEEEYKPPVVEAASSPYNRYRTGSAPPPIIGSKPLGNNAPPPRNATATAAPPKRRAGGIALALAAILAILLAATYAAFRTGMLTYVGGQPNGFPFIIAPTPTHIGYAGKATVTITRATQNIRAAASTLVAATDNSGDIAAKAVTASVTGVKTAAQPAKYQPANEVIFTVTVTNNTGNPQNSGGATITSSDGKVTCTIQGSVNIQPNSSQTQQCIEQSKSEPAEHWNDSTSNPPLVYTGDSPAGGNAPYYYVPDGCGDPTPMQAAVRSALQAQLQTPNGSIIFAGPAYVVNTASLACAPAAGTQQAAAFAYVQTGSGAASETVFAGTDAITFQTARLKQAVPQNYTLLSSSICPNGPKPGGDATATRVTITCAATGVAAWNWTPGALSALARTIAGSSTGTAALQINQTAGIISGSVKISLTGGTLLPDDPAAIAFVVTP